jgi:hypothetical protein
MADGVELVLTDLPRLLLEASVLLSLAVLMNLFLPILIFEAALMLSTREFMRNLIPIGALATVALVISAILVGFSMNLTVGLSISVALLFGVIISATDPVAVVAIFRELGVPNRLLTIVERESMVNDGVAIILSQILVVAALGGTLSVTNGISRFVSVFVGGILIGGVIGVVAVLLLPLLGRLPAAAISVAVAYGSYVMADSVLGFSGVMATVAAGAVMGSMTESRVNREVREILHEFWDALAYIANAHLIPVHRAGIGLFADRRESRNHCYYNARRPCGETARHRSAGMGPRKTSGDSQGGYQELRCCGLGWPSGRGGPGSGAGLGLRSAGESNDRRCDSVGRCPSRRGSPVSWRRRTCR